MAKKLIKEYVFSPGLGIDDNSRPNAYDLISQNKTFLQQEIVAYIQNQVDAANPDYVGYTYDEAKCLRDSEYVIDALLFDIRYGGNEETRRVSGFYWNKEVPQIDGNRIPEYEAYQFLRDTINTYIITNVINPSPEQADSTQVATGAAVEEGTSGRVTALLDDLVAVIQNGLSSTPTLEVGLGRIEILGKIELEDLLIISNVTSNEVIYSFTDPTRGAETKFTAGDSEGFPRALSINNGTTIINFKYSTSDMASTDKIQLFLESAEQKVRPYDFGTDAIERMRVGLPQAMIDADFEYGLQPTKWQAISMQRGYPATYEINASDIPVSTVVTDASAGNSGIGASLITVTTVGPHGLSTGDAITIKALASSIVGFNRAEGTFIVYDIPSTTTFTYYAKAKVGTSNNQILATSSTQLRAADFYTGADIGTPTFSVSSNGSNGSFTTPLIVPSGSNFIAFSATATPPNGAPLTGTGIPTGTQVTGVAGTGLNGGSVKTVRVETGVSSGATEIELEDATGITTGMAIPDDWFDSTTPEQRIITSINGNTITLNDAITTSFIGNTQTYNNIILSTSNNVAGTASNATFFVNVDNDLYDIVGVDTPGSGYNIGDTIKILGTQVGGLTPDNDLYLKVTATAEDSTVGSITEVILLTGNGSGTGTFSGLSGTQSTNPVASNGDINITRDSGGYIFGGVNDGGSEIYDGEQYTVTGDNLGGTSPANDVTFRVQVDGGEISNIYDVTGTSVLGDTFDVYSAVSVSQATTSQLGISSPVTYSSIATIQVDFDNNHGLVPGASINVSIGSDDGSNNHAIAGGPFFISEIPSLTSLRYITRNPGTVDTTTDIDGLVYARPDAFFSHRAFDGGVQLGTGGPQHGAQAIRQSKKYIRYQSGKGAMYNTGALFAPSYDVRSVTAADTASGSLITIIMDDQDHGLQSGCKIRLVGVNTTGYDNDYTVNSIIDERTFTVNAKTALGSTTGEVGPQCQVATLTWHGAVVRSGPFDDQNGIFFQYDGQQLSVVRRSATFQCAGTISVNSDENEVNGTNTRFQDQLQEGDRIVIRGMTHVVSHIVDNIKMYVTPDFRGVSNITGAKISKVEDIVIPQSEWNLDRCDGTGPSGYEVDVTKMQMIGIQFSWYGAGFIDWMFRGPNGDYVYAHRLKGNNLNTEAYMRTGNLPVRYEVTNEGARSRLNGAIDATQQTITLDNTSLFPESGQVYINNELISYTGKNDTTNQLTGCNRGATLTNFAAGATRTYTAGSASTHSDNSGAVLVSSTTSPIISHWGSAYMIDGLFDEDRGYIFNYVTTGVPISTTKQTAFLIRLAPSVSNAVTGDLGERELLNRAQLLLDSLSITSDTGSGGIIIEGVLNPQNYPDNPNDIAWNGLTSEAAGGQPSFAQIALGGSVNWAGGASVVTPTATIEGQVTSNFTPWYWTGAGLDALQNGDDDWFIPNSEYDVSGLEVGDIFLSASVSGDFSNKTGSRTPNVIREINRSRNGSTFTRIKMSGEWTGSDQTGGSQGASNITLSFAKQGTSSTYSNSNVLYFTETSWESAGTTINSLVADTQTEFPANTRVAGVKELLFGTATYYQVSFTQSFRGTFAATDTITFNLSQPPYAQPGETVFSFISNPGETETLSLEKLKELTTTSIGGRGTFPNGPDVLAINVYKISGADVNASLILRWGEAQA